MRLLDFDVSLDDRRRRLSILRESIEVH
jgi:hypothetical protein